MAGVLKITDGTTEVILTQSARPATASGLHRATLDQGWLPKVAEYKAGGVWQDSPLSDNRTLATTQFQNVVESFRLNLRDASMSLYPTGTGNASAQDLMIRTLQEIRRLLEKAAAYWTTSWQDTPVYLVAQAEYETNARYAILYRGSIPEDKDPYFKLFERVGDPMMLALDCIVERGHWTANAPGTGVCVMAAGQHSWEGITWEENTAQPVIQVITMIELSTGWMLAGERNQVWRTNTGAAVWAAAAAPPAGDVYGFAEQGGWAYCVTNTGGVYRSNDNGNNWVLRNAAMLTTFTHNFLAASDGYLYAGGTLAGVGGIHRSNDGGATWTTVYPGGARMCMFEDSNGVLYGATGIIVRSTNGVTWTPVFYNGGVGSFAAFVEAYGYIFGVTDALIIGVPPGYVYRTVDGISWGEAAVLSDILYDIIAPSYGGLLVTSANGNFVAYGSEDGTSWRPASFGALNAHALVQFSGNGDVYMGVGVAGAIWRESRIDTTVGRSETCDDGVFVVNKDNVAQLTHILVYDASGPTYTSQFPTGSFPFYIFPNPPAVDDIFYAGIEEPVGAIPVDTGPFDNLVFRIGIEGIVGAITLAWEYSDGGAGWPTLNVQDGTTNFRLRGDRSVHWVPPTDWAVEAVNGITAYWVRARITAITTSTSAPTQTSQNIYTCNWSCVDIDDAQVPGDIPAMLQIKFNNRSDEDAYVTFDELDTLENRVIVGLRTMSRAESPSVFMAYLNCADEQNPVGVGVAVGANSAFVTELPAPSGRCVEHTTPGGGLTAYTNECTFTFGPSIARDFYGTFHAFLRAQLHEPSSSPVGDHDDVRLRLRIQSGAGGITSTTDYRKFIGWDGWDAVAGEEKTYKDWQLLDFGQVKLPTSELFNSTELPDEMNVIIQISSAASTNLRVDLYDLVLIAVDEWAGDFVDNALEDDSGVTNGYLLEVDSVTFPKKGIRALVRKTEGDQIRSVYQPIVNGPAILQANADQRLWFLTARGVYMGQQDGGDAQNHLDDSFADFIDAGVRVGMIVVNVTDGSSATITAVTATRIDGTLTGGTGDDWDNDDEYYIICPCWRSEPWNAHSVRLTGNSRYLSMRGDR